MEGKAQKEQHAATEGARISRTATARQELSRKRSRITIKANRGAVALHIQEEAVAAAVA